MFSSNMTSSTCFVIFPASDLYLCTVKFTLSTVKFCVIVIFFVLFPSFCFLVALSQRSSLPLGILCTQWSCIGWNKGNGGCGTGTVLNYFSKLFRGWQWNNFCFLISGVKLDWSWNPPPNIPVGAEPPPPTGQLILPLHYILLDIKCGICKNFI